MTTLREIHERCKARHTVSNPQWYTVSAPLCDACGAYFPCPDYSDAAAALAILDASTWGCRDPDLRLIPDATIRQSRVDPAPLEKGR